MNDDKIWVVIVIMLNVLIMASSLAIATHLRLNEKGMRPCPAKTAIRRLSLIFVLMAMNMGFYVMLVFWPAWRLKVILLAVLFCVMWAYTIKAGSFAVIFVSQQDAQALRWDLAEMKQQETELLARLQSLEAELASLKAK